MSAPTDHDARVFATDPSHNVVLEASAGTGKTSVLVARYLNLLRAGVAPANILAITFTRQAAGEMRERIIDALRREATESEVGRQRWHDLRDRLAEVAISTVDAFCLSLLREFPLEADLDPGFGMADETEVPRLVDDAVDRALAIASHMAGQDAGVAMLLARLGPQRTRVALRSMLERRLVVPAALHRFLKGVPPDLTGERVCHAAVTRLEDRLSGLRRDVTQLVEADVLDDPRAAILARDLRRVSDLADADPATIRAWLDRLRDVFLTQSGAVRKTFPLHTRAAQPIRRRYRQAAATLAPHVHEVLSSFDRDVNVVMTRAVQRLFAVVSAEYQRALRARALLDFSDVLQRAVALLRQMDEFARSRYRLESRYHHVLVDEFQDTSRLQWELVSLLVQSWGEGSGLVEEAPLPPTIFVVGDRKQSIYRFRDADVSMFGQATDEIASLRADADVHRTIAHSFRAVPPLLGFVNDLFGEIGGAADGGGTFRFGDRDRFPVEREPSDDVQDEALGVIVGEDIQTCADVVADEVVALLETGQVRQKHGSDTRAVTPQDIAVLFRTRESHREFERALDRRSVPTYVYKGLGFFDADEIKDARALIRFLANPRSELRAAALLRSRVVGISDPGLLALAGKLSESLVGAEVLPETPDITEDDRRVLYQARRSFRHWMGLVDRLPPAEVLDRVLSDAAYAFELRGPHVAQAEANLRRLRGLVRRIQNRGYATMARVADQIDQLSADMSNAVIEAFDAVNLMTVHAAKGLEFSIVFLVDLGRGTRTHEAPVRVIPDRGDGTPSVTVWPYRSDADDEERRRDLEETKRLFYVATTRARDRLYLSAVVESGTPKLNPGSFGSIFPGGFATVFAHAALASSGGRVVWQGQSGASHTFRVGRVLPADRQRSEGPSKDPDPIPAALVDVPMWPAVTRVSATGSSPPEGAHIGPASGGHDATFQRQTGGLVHALIRACEGQTVDSYRLEHLAREIRDLGDDTDHESDDDVVHIATRIYTKLVKREEMTSIAGQHRLWEVPFSYRSAQGSGPSVRAESVVLRGTIDCLARDSEGRVTVLELKTGRPRPEHQQQLDMYVAAARAMFPGSPVEGRLVYP